MGRWSHLPLTLHLVKGLPQLGLPHHTMQQHHNILLHMDTLLPVAIPLLPLVDTPAIRLLLLLEAILLLLAAILFLPEAILLLPKVILLLLKVILLLSEVILLLPKAILLLLAATLLLLLFLLG